MLKVEAIEAPDYEERGDAEAKRPTSKHVRNHDTDTGSKMGDLEDLHTAFDP